MLSVIIVNWNSKDYVRQCLKSLFSTCSGLAPQIIVVDGASFDGCGDMISAQFPSVEFIQNSRNSGFGSSNNLGFHEVRNEMVLFLNPDTELRPGAVSQLISELHNLPEAGVLGARLVNSDASLQESCVQNLPNPWNQFLDSALLRTIWPNARLWGTKDAFASSVPVEVEAVSGACMLMHAETFRRVGGFSPQYFMYGEDMDLCAKVRRLGLKIYHVPGAKVVHHGAGCSQQLSGSAAVLMRTSVHQFIREHQGTFAASTYRVLMAVSSVSRLVLLAPACVLSRSAKRALRLRSLKKWMGVLQWSVGFEAPGVARS